MEKEIEDAVGITQIDTALQIIESEALKRAVASELLIPDPDEQNSLDKEEDNG